MIPILYASTENEFLTNGLGGLSDAITCNVIEELNGAYELEMQYPITGIHYSDILVDRIVYAKPSDDKDPQPFDIYKISKPIDGIVTIYAKHISYRASYFPVKPFEAETGIDNAIETLKKSVVTDRDFPFTINTIRMTDNETVFANKTPRSFRDCFGKGTDSIIGVFGGEVEWDKFDIKLYAHRGEEKNIRIAYSKNLTKLRHDEDSSEKITAIYPYWSSSNGDEVMYGDVVHALIDSGYNKVTGEITPEWESNKYYVAVPNDLFVSEETFCDETVVVTDGKEPTEFELTKEEPADWSTNYTDYYEYWEIRYSDNDAYVKIKTMNFTSYFEEMPTKEQLNDTAKEYMKKNNIGKNSVGMDVSFVALWQTEEYKNIAPLEHVVLGDTVTVETNHLGVSESSRVIKTDYNVLSDRYDEISLGDANTSLTETVSSISNKIETTTKEAKYSLETTLKKQTELMNGALGGHVYFETDPNGRPTAIYIANDAEFMSHPDSGNVIRINQNGIGFSNMGYNGRFSSAWTIDGIFSADNIKTGKMSGDRIEAGTITADKISLETREDTETAANSLSNFVRINSGGIEIGNANSPVKLIQRNDKVYFTNKDGTENYGYISSDGFYTSVFKVTDEMDLINYHVSTEDGLAFRYMGNTGGNE